MANTDQVNVRVPLSSTDLVRQIAQRLRQDPGFAQVLRRVLDDCGSLLSAAPLQRLTQVESTAAQTEEAVRSLGHRVEALERGRGGHRPMPNRLDALATAPQRRNTGDEPS